MSQAFVWFHNHSASAEKAKVFYEKLLGWKGGDGPHGSTLFADAKGPLAALGPKERDIAGWLPYAQVDDLDAATKAAVKLGAEVLSSKTRGPAGEFSVLRDPGGALLALWQKG